MGGRVAVGIIDGNGKLETVIGRTNALPKTFKNASFVDGDFSALDDFMEYFRHNRHDEGYGPSANVPCEYGYVLFDLREKAIVSAQDYTSVRRISGPQVKDDEVARMISARIEHDETGDERAIAVGPYESADDFAADASNDPRKGVPTVAQIFEEIRGLAPAEFGKAGGFDQLEAIFDGLPAERRIDFTKRLADATKADQSGPVTFRYELDFRDWSVFDGSRDASDLEHVRDYLAQRAPLSGEENEIWNSTIANLRSADARPDGDGPSLSL